MTVPKWIAAALEDATLQHPGGEVFPVLRVLDDEKLAAALIERLPIEAMVVAATMSVHGDERTDRSVARDVVGHLVALLAEGAADAVYGATMYLRAGRALDVAGVPYANTDEVPVPLDLAARIRWLAQQRPTRLDLQRVEAERDEARADSAGLRRQLEELARHVKGSPLGWVDGRTMVHRSTADSDVAEWLQRLEALAMGAD